MRGKRVPIVLALVGVAVVALVGPLSSAVGFFSNGLSLDVRVDSPAALVSRGAAVNVPLTVVCTGRRAFVEVGVSQRAGSQIAQGFAEREIVCTGDLQPVTFTVFANGKAFKKGRGIVEAQIFGCGFGVCGDESDTAEIAFTNKKH